MRHQFRVGFKRVAAVALGLACVGWFCGCPQRVETPVLRGGESSDFNESVESFLKKIPQSEQATVVQTLLFLVMEDMDPEAYAQKGLADLLKLNVPEVLKSEVYEKTGMAICHLAQQKFMEKRASLEVELEAVRTQLEGFRAKLEAQARQESLLAGFLIRGFQVRYEQAPFKMLAYLNFTVDNQSTATLTGLVFRVRFEGLAAGVPGVGVLKRESFAEPLAPGQSRSFTLLASECPKIPNKTPAQYAQLLRASVQVANGVLSGGTPLLATIPDLQLEQDLQQAKAMELEILGQLEASASRDRFLMWGRLPAVSH